MSYVPRHVEHKADLDKQIEIEMANLMYFEYKNKEEAYKEAKEYIETKYKDVVEALKSKGKY